MTNPDPTRLSRRGVLAGGLVLAFSLETVPMALAAPPPAELRRHPSPNSWLQISAAGAVTLLVGKVELGQGILTAYAQLCADELDVALSRISVVSGDTARCPNQGITAGSMSIPSGGAAVRQVCADARALLLRAAAETLGIAVDDLTVEDGTISGGERRVTYWSLASPALLSREGPIGSIRSYGRRREVGRRAPRLDLPAKVVGQTAFIQDLRPTGMLHARVVRPPGPQSRLISVDDKTTEQAPGVVAVVRNGSFLAVVAEHEWSAIKAARRLQAQSTWSRSPVAADNDHTWLRRGPVRSVKIKDTTTGSPAAGRALRGSYGRGFLMHGSIGPSCAVALFDGETLTVDTHSQSVFETGEAIAKLVGLAPQRVRMRHVQGAGCYGHNGADDAAAEAALIAMRLRGRPIRLQWMRQEEHAFEPYGSPMAQDIAATLDAEGRVVQWRMDLWSASHMARPLGAPGNFLAGQLIEPAIPVPEPINPGGPAYAADRNAIPSYDFAEQSITTHLAMAPPLRTSSLRSLGAHGNVFAIESFVDELAVVAGTDPLDFRLRHLSDPRARATLERAAASFGWRTWRKSSGHGRGLGFARYKNSDAYCAVCLEVDASAGSIRLVRAVVAADAGQIVNPDGLSNQLEGGLLQALSWSLMEQVSVAGGVVASSDWSAYPILRFSGCPSIQVEMIDHPAEPSLGAGECVCGPAAGALANAVADATGRRPRRLPIQPAA